MSDFVYDGTSLMGTKSDAHALTGAADQSVTAAEVNTLVQGVIDLRTALLAGQYHGLEDNAAAVSAAAKARLRLSGELLQVSIDGSDYRSLERGRVKNALDYGVTGDGSTDDTLAIQAMFDDAEEGDNFFFPAGEYRLTKPIYLYESYCQVFGEGYETYFNANTDGVKGPLMLFGSPPTAFPTATINSMNGLDCRGDPQWIYPLFENDLLLRNGTTAFTVEVLLTPTSAGRLHDGICQCAGTRDSGTSGNQVAWAVKGRADGFIFDLNVSGTVQTIQYTGGAPTLNAVHLVECSYDGTTMRMYIDGVLAASAVHAGTITQSPWTATTIGPCAQGWPDYPAPSTNTYRAIIHNVRIFSTTRHTANYTAVLTKPAPGGTGLLGRYDFDNTYGPFMLGKTGSAENGTHFSFRRDQNLTGFQQQTDLRSFRIQGGIFMWGCADGIVERLYINGTCYGLNLNITAYDMTIRHLKVLGSSAMHFAIGSLLSCVGNHFSDISIAAGSGDAFVVGDSLTYIENTFLNGTPNRAALNVRGGGILCSVIATNLFITDENQVAASFAGLLISSPDVCQFNGLTIDHGQDSPLIAVCNPTARVVLHEPSFSQALALGAQPLVTYLGGGSARNEIVINNPRFRSGEGTRARCDATGHVVYNLDRQSSQVTIAAAATTGTYTFGQAQPDTSYRVSVTPVTVSGAATAGSSRVRSVSKSTTAVTITVETAPGAGESVVFDVVIDRN